MAIALQGPMYNDPGSLTKQAEAHDLLYNLTGTIDPTEVRAYLRANIPATFDGLPLDQIQYEHKGAGLWAVKAAYKTKEAARVRGTTKGGTTKLFTSLFSEAFGPPGVDPGDLPDFHGAINVQNGAVQGVDVPIPVYSFTIQIKVDATSVASNLISSLYLLTGKINDAIFAFTYHGQAFSFELGELRFDGVDWEIDASDQLNLDLAFSASPHETSLTLGEIEDIYKPGWSYLWTYFRETVSASSIVPTPTAVYVEDVLEVANFSVIEGLLA